MAFPENLANFLQVFFVGREQKGRGVDGAGNWEDFVKIFDFFLHLFRYLYRPVPLLIDEFFRFCFLYGLEPLKI